MILRIRVASYLGSSFHRRWERAAEESWKQVWYMARKDPNFRKMIPLIILQNLMKKIPLPGIEDKNG